MNFHEMSFYGKIHNDHLTMRFISLDASEPYKSFILSTLEQKYTLRQTLTILGRQYGVLSLACHFSHALCKWGFFREHWDYTQLDEYQIVINQIARKLANSMSSKEAGYIWDVSHTETYPLLNFTYNRNPLAMILLSRARTQYGQEKQVPYQRASLRGPISNLISELPRQPDRKVCMTCGERVDGVIYCSEQCRPSASLGLYSYQYYRAETPTITEGFRTARSRFISPSADSCATYDTTQFVPPPYGLVDANPPTPKFVPTKEEPQEERGIEELTLYSGPEEEPAWTSFVSPPLP